MRAQIAAFLYVALQVVGAKRRARHPVDPGEALGKVERPIRYLRQSFYYGRTFLNDDDLNTQGQSWLDGTANMRRHRTISESPRERFERDERETLKPLALTPYPRLGTIAPSASATRLPYPVEVQQRPLSVYAEAVR